MVSQSLLEAVVADVRRHCEAKGYREGPGVNNFVPHDAVDAFGMAGQLASAGFDHFLAIAPEGHIYGYFLERLGVPVLSVFTDYPPTRCDAEDDLRVVEGGRVLLIEDDVIGGRTLRLVVEHLRQFAPASLALYLGHTKGIQHLRNVPAEVAKVYVAEDFLKPGDREGLERRFEAFFGNLLAGESSPASTSTASASASRPNLG
ncbi:phosphoribosyltransferase [Zavarzinella formosa]|uniref:phosphoribosyltransferase n=1 Tax=Zavarzinella formosa TaxID=360055 RepID=UPI000304DEFE|nr:phosphoribosyltransferase [Zavarzinella formosa]